MNRNEQRLDRAEDALVEWIADHARSYDDGLRAAALVADLAAAFALKMHREQLRRRAWWRRPLIAMGLASA